MPDESQGAKPGRRLKVERVEEKYVPGGGAYWLVSADGEPLEPLLEGQIVEVVVGEEAEAHGRP